MTTALVTKLTGVRDFRKILETTVKDLSDTYAADVTQIVLSNPLDRNITSICEYRANPEQGPGDMPQTTLPLVLVGGGMGMVSLARQDPLNQDEIDYIRITLAELADVVRFAQINDIVQRDTFRNTFLLEIGNVMNYSLGIGDALFMVVNILGKVLNTSRCLFICVDDTHSDWKCYEFWQREHGIQSCQEFAWPTTDSPIVARSLLSRSPLVVLEGQSNSYLQPVQEELEIMGVRSLLGVALRSEEATHGCVILQQCESRHAWTRGEIDMVQAVADTVADALAKLPEEKRAREPIMRLHQRVIAEAGTADRDNIQAVRRALKGVLGPQTIPSARKTSEPVARPAPPVAPPPPPTPPAVPPAPVAQPEQPPAVAPQAAPGETPAEPTGAQASASLNTLLGGMRGTTQEILKGLGLRQPSGAPVSPWEPSAPAAGTPAGSAPETQPGLEAVPAAEPAGDFSPWGEVPVSPAPVPEAAAVVPGDLDAIPTPRAAPAGGPWGNLDAIPTPTTGSRGLGASMLGRRAGTTPASPLLASLHRDKSRFPAPQVERLEGPPIEIDEAQARARLSAILSSANPTSDYIFATPDLDPRMLGRIEGWISEIEQKDKYLTPHALNVAQISVAIAAQMGLLDEQILGVRIAALVHDIGKLALAPAILQSPDEELSDQELLTYMKHPIEGAKLIESFPEIAYLAPLILAHHEDYNGNGYPAGLSGEDIPVGARIIHLAATYHGLVCPLRFREAMDPADARSAIAEESGRTFDPPVVDALFACLDEGRLPPLSTG